MLNNYAAGQKLLCGSYTQYTPYGKGNFVRNNRWGDTPKVGSPIYFYSATEGRVAHVGIVIEVSYDRKSAMWTIKTVEGNTSSGNAFDRNGGCVAIKTYSFTKAQVGGRNRINGFGYPVFGSDTCSVDTFVEVAKGEVGYIEKASKKSLDDKTANPGTANYTKYGEWYGYLPAYWCQQYVSWVAYMACLITQTAKTDGWYNTEKGWMYRLNGKDVKNRWLEIDGRWYVFDAAGYAIVNWFKSEDLWYYLNPADCAMLSNQWIEDGGKWYFLADNGVTVTNAYVLGKNGMYMWIDANGVYDIDRDTSVKPAGDTYEVYEVR